MAVAVSTRDKPASPPEVPGSPAPTAVTSAWLLGAIVVLGAALRFSTLGEQSFWSDEATTWGIVAHGLGHLWTTVPKTESTPPLYYLLLWFWSRAFGIREVGLRSLSALFGTLTIPVMWAIGRRLVSERVGLVAALLTAVNPLLFWYSQEARAYALMLMMSALTVLMLVRALEQPSRRRLLAWGVVSAIAICSHYFAAFAVVPEAVWLGIALRRRGLLSAANAVVAAGPVVVIGAALLPLVIRQNDGRASYISNESGSLAYRLGQLVKQDVIGDGQPAKALLTALGCLLVAGALVLLSRRGSASERRAAWLPIALGAAGVVLALLVCIGITDYFDTRNMLSTWPALALVVAIGLGCARAGRAGALLTAGLVVLALFCISIIIRDPNWQRDNWRGAAHAIGPVSAPRAIVADKYSVVPLTPYLSHLAAYPAGGVSVREVDMIWLQRGHYGRPLIQITPAPLPGFQLHETRTDSYIVVRYLAPKPVVEPMAVLQRLYPLLPRSLTLLQPP
jgi:mannosyltransferase